MTFVRCLLSFISKMGKTCISVATYLTLLLVKASFTLWAFLFDILELEPKFGVT
jgi:hypothetical protein